MRKKTRQKAENHYKWNSKISQLVKLVNLAKLVNLLKLVKLVKLDKPGKNLVKKVETGQISRISQTDPTWSKYQN